MTDYKEAPLMLGKMVKVDTGSFVSVGPNLDRGMIYGKPIIEFFYNKAKEIAEPVIFDIGASVGSFSMLSKFLDKSKIYAFEPQIKIFELLKSNICLNELNDVFVFNMALSNIAGRAKMSIPTRADFSGLGTLSLKPLRFSDGNILDIDCDTLDNFCDRNQIKKIDMIKIDTEGSEYRVLLGGIETIKKFKPSILMEFNHENMSQCGVSSNQITKLLEELNYKYEVCNVGEEDIFCEYKQKS